MGHLGGLLVCREAGATVRELSDRELVVTDHVVRRLVVAGATAGLTADLIAARAVSGRS